MNDNNKTPEQGANKYDIFGSLKQEREYQRQKWGDETDDTLNTPNDFVTYISAYSTKWFPKAAGGFLPLTSDVVDEFRTSMMKTAALAIAAVESIDRQREEAGHTFYEGIRE